MDENRNNEGERIVNPQRTKSGEYVMQQRPRYFSSIVMPSTTRYLETMPTFLSLISSQQFIGMDHKDSYNHLSVFYEQVGTMRFEERNLETIYLRLFPFSLAGKAKEGL